MWKIRIISLAEKSSIAAGDDPRFDDIYDREDEEDYALRREAYLIELATANARTQYIETGHAPTFAEAWAKVQDPPVSAGDFLSEPSAVADGLTLPKEMSRDSKNHLQPSATANGSDSNSVEKASDDARFGAEERLKLSHDGYGREIFVETEEENTGKPTIWYQTDPKGNKFRFTRNGYGINREQLF